MFDFAGILAHFQPNRKSLNLSLLAAPLFTAAVLLPSHPASAQAHVVENEPASVYVDAAAGSDSNPGTASRPLRSITGGVRVAEQFNVRGLGVKVLINPGIYREFVNIAPKWHNTAAPMTFEAVKAGTAVISGSDVFTGWYQGTSNSAIYTHDWNYNFGECRVPAYWPTNLAPVVLRREMVFVNGGLLTQVMSLPEMQPGTFFVNEAVNRLHVWPVAGTDMSKAKVEVAVRPDTLKINHRSNIVLRGLVLEHAASCMDLNGADVFHGDNVLIDGVQANWNNWGALGIHGSTNVTVQNSVASHNGGVGFSGNRTRDVLFQFDESDYNNWRGAMGAFYDFGMGGSKFMMVHRATVNQFYAYNNQAQGLWFDTDNRQIAISNATLSGNGITNLQIELNAGPISLSNSTLCYGEIGVNLVNSSQVTLTGNHLYNNGGSTQHSRPQFYLAGQPGGRHFIDWETHTYHNVISRNVTFSNNVFEDGGANQEVFATYHNGADWAAFQSTLQSNNNSWYDGVRPNAFTMPRGQHATLGEWKKATGQDSSSVWSPQSSAAQNCAAPAPQMADFSVTADNRAYSMSRGKAIIRLKVKAFGNLGVGGASNSSSSVQISTASLPSGVTAALNIAPATAGVSDSSITLHSSGAAHGTVPVTILAKGAGQLHTVRVLVTL